MLCECYRPLPQAKYPDVQAAAAFHQKLIERVASLPGARSAGVINFLPLQQWGFNGGIAIEGQGPYEPGREPLAEFRSISPDYFRAMSVPLISGRFFTAQDQGNSAPVVIVNQTLAQRHLPGQDPIGKRIRSVGNNWRTVVGVVGDVRQSGVTQAVGRRSSSPSHRRPGRHWRRPWAWSCAPTPSRRR
jgi:putative ABC transport system permease protein